MTEQEYKDGMHELARLSAQAEKLEQVYKNFEDWIEEMYRWFEDNRTATVESETMYESAGQAPWNRNGTEDAATEREPMTDAEIQYRAEMAAQ